MSVVDGSAGWPLVDLSDGDYCNDPAGWRIHSLALIVGGPVTGEFLLPSVSDLPTAGLRSWLD